MGDHIEIDLTDGRPLRRQGPERERRGWPWALVAALAVTGVGWSAIAGDDGDDGDDRDAGSSVTTPPTLAPPPAPPSSASRANATSGDRDESAPSAAVGVPGDSGGIPVLDLVFQHEPDHPISKYGSALVDDALDDIGPTTPNHLVVQYRLGDRRQGRLLLRSDGDSRYFFDHRERAGWDEIRYYDTANDTTVSRIRFHSDDTGLIEDEHPLDERWLYRAFAGPLRHDQLRLDVTTQPGLYRSGDLSGSRHRVTLRSSDLPGWAGLWFLEGVAAQPIDDTIDFQVIVDGQGRLSWWKTEFEVSVNDEIVTCEIAGRSFRNWTFSIDPPNLSPDRS